MAENADEIRVAQGFRVLAAPAGTELPADIGDTLNAAFVPIGFVDDKGATISDKVEKGEVRAAGKRRPVRKWTKRITTMLKFAMEQFNADTMVIAAGGGAFTETDTGYRFDPPGPTDSDLELAIILEGVDSVDGVEGDIIDWFIFPKVVNTNGIETTLNSEDASMLPVEFEATPEDDTGWYHLSNFAGKAPTNYF